MTVDVYQIYFTFGRFDGYGLKGTSISQPNTQNEAECGSFAINSMTYRVISTPPIPFRGAPLGAGAWVDRRHRRIPHPMRMRLRLAAGYRRVNSMGRGVVDGTGAFHFSASALKRTDWVVEPLSITPCGSQWAGGTQRYPLRLSPHSMTARLSRHFATFGARTVSRAWTHSPEFMSCHRWWQMET